MRRSLLGYLLVLPGCAITLGSPTSQGDFSSLIGSDNNTPTTTTAPSAITSAIPNGSAETTIATFAKPTNVKTQEQNGNLLVSWDPVFNAEGYRVYRDKTLWFDKLPTSSVVLPASEWRQTRHIAIEAYRGNQRSESLFVDISTLIDSSSPSTAAPEADPVLQEAPSGLRYTALGNQEIEVNWNVLPDAASYSIAIIYDDPDFKNMEYTELSIPTIRLTSVPYGKNIRIAVWGANSRGKSPQSEFNFSLSPLTPTPTPTPTSDISVIEATSFHGRVFGDGNELLSGVTVVAKSLNSSVPFEATTTTATNGKYDFKNAPTGVQIEITASRNGLTSRRRLAVLKALTQNETTTNQFDFGTNGSIGTGSQANALSDKPEVVSVTPGRNASGIDPKTSFVLKFSEPMDRNSVEDAFSVHVYQDRQLSIHNRHFLFGNTTFINLNSGYGGFTHTKSLNAALIWDESDFTAIWNSDDSEVTFTFTDEKLLPTDRDSSKTPEYMVSFSQGHGAKMIKDKSGAWRHDQWFKITDGDAENYVKHAIRTDESRPHISSIIASSAETGSLRGDTIKVRFSERMVIDTKAGDIGASNSIINQNLQQSPSNPSLYTVDVRSALYEMTYNWGLDVQGTATFDADDPTRKTIILQPANPEQQIFQPRDVITVRVSDNIVDPAGNTMESNLTTKTTTAG